MTVMGLGTGLVMVLVWVGHWPDIGLDVGLV